jgi:hypothetical protein
MKRCLCRAAGNIVSCGMRRHSITQKDNVMHTAAGGASYK